MFAAEFEKVAVSEAWKSQRVLHGLAHRAGEKPTKKLSQIADKWTKQRQIPLSRTGISDWHAAGTKRNPKEAKEHLNWLRGKIVDKAAK